MYYWDWVLRQIKYILENHVAFKQAMEGLKVQFDQAGEQLKAERLRINELEMKLRELKPSTQDYNQLDEEVNRAKADWSINANKQKKEIRKRESQILWKVYYDVKTETKRYCEQNRIDLVISFRRCCKCVILVKHHCDHVIMII